MRQAIVTVIAGAIMDPNNPTTTASVADPIVLSGRRPLTCGLQCYWVVMGLEFGCLLISIAFVQ